MLSARGEAERGDERLWVHCPKCGAPVTLTIERRGIDGINAWTCPHRQCRALHYQRCDGPFVDVKRGHVRPASTSSTHSVYLND